MIREQLMDDVRTCDGLLVAAVFTPRQAGREGRPTKNTGHTRQLCWVLAGRPPASLRDTAGVAWRHATGPCRRHRLTIELILHVPGGRRNRQFVRVP